MPEYLWQKLTRLASLSSLRLLRLQLLQENNTNCIVFDKPAYVFFFFLICASLLRVWKDCFRKD